MALNRGIPCVIDSPKSKVAEAFVHMVGLLKKEDIYVPSTEIKKQRSVENLEKPGEFWSKFGISQQVSGMVPGKVYTSEDEKILSLKKIIHEKLVERLNLDGIANELLSDPESVARIKKSAEQVVANLLTEEAGGKIASYEERRRLVNDIVNEALGLGALEDFLADPDVTDIMVNNKDELYIEKNGKLILWTEMLPVPCLNALIKGSSMPKPFIKR